MYYQHVCCHDCICQVVASDLSPSAVPIGDIDWSVPTAVVLGNEERGISDSMRNMADATFVIPMRGFVRSFNMSVACSIILAHLSAVRYECCILILYCIALVQQILVRCTLLLYHYTTLRCLGVCFVGGFYRSKQRRQQRAGCPVRTE